MVRLMGTGDVVRALGGEGFRLTSGTVTFYLRAGYLARPEMRGPGDATVWASADVDRLRGVLRRRGRGPKAHEQGARAMKPTVSEALGERVVREFGVAGRLVVRAMENGGVEVLLVDPKSEVYEGPLGWPLVDGSAGLGWQRREPPGEALLRRVEARITEAHYAIDRMGLPTRAVALAEAALVEARGICTGMGIVVERERDRVKITVHHPSGFMPKPERPDGWQSLQKDDGMIFGWWILAAPAQAAEAATAAVAAQKAYDPAGAPALAAAWVVERVAGAKKERAEVGAEAAEREVEVGAE